MKRIIYVFSLALLLVSCAPKQVDKVMARYVPERKDDFVWENEKICYRAYGQALESETLSPGFDVWAKRVDALVADEWYDNNVNKKISYHKDYGQGKDCYKVSKSLGGGASSPVVNGEFVFPATNYRSYDILKSESEEAQFVLHYPAWDVDGKMVSLDKKITVKAGTHFCEIEDVYSGDFESITIAAGIWKHDGPELFTTDGNSFFAIWERASDTSEEVEDGMLGLALIMQDADSVTIDGPADHAVAYKSIKPGESVKYSIGSCFSKGSIKSWDEWLMCVDAAL